MAKKTFFELSAIDEKIVEAHLCWRSLSFDTRTGARLITHEFNRIKDILKIIQFARRLAVGKRDLFTVSKDQFGPRYRVTWSGVMKEIHFTRGSIQAVANLVPSWNLNPEAVLFIESLYAIVCQDELRTFFNIEKEFASKVCENMNKIIKTYREMANSSNWKKAVRSFYRAIVKNHESMREYLLELSNKHRNLQCIWFDFLFQQVDIKSYLENDVNSLQIEEARRSVIRFIKNNAPDKSHVGFVWQISTSLYQGSRLSVLSFYDQKDSHEFENHIAKVKDFWREVVTQGQGFCAHRPLPSGYIPQHVLYNHESKRKQIEAIAVSFTKTHAYIRARVDKGKTVGHGTISRARVG